MAGQTSSLSGVEGQVKSKLEEKRFATFAVSAVKSSHRKDRRGARRPLRNRTTLTSPPRFDDRLARFYFQTAHAFCYSAAFHEETRMRMNKILLTTCSVLLCCSLPSVAADKKSKDSKPAETAKPSYELPQPTTETIDLVMYNRIRDEGLQHSHIMEYASALMDGIGPRLTGSPNLKRANEWTRDQL